MLSRSALKPRHRNAPRPAEKSAPQFLQWLRGRQCAVAATGRAGAVEACEGKIEAAHVDYAGGKGVGTKVADRFAIPLCSYHHARQHAVGWDTFDRHWLGGVSMALFMAADYWRAWPGRIAWERKQEAGRG